MEEILIFTFAGIITILFTGNIVLFLLSPLIEHIRKLRDENIYSSREKRKLSIINKYENYFLGKFSFYDKLPDNLRLKFLLRVKRFVQAKTFKGHQDLEVTEEMKMMIAASAIQLTFGLSEFIFDHFSDIIIYPESYYSPVTGLYHMGEANPAGILVISWKDFLRGYEKPHDAFNVGLHEMAHALELEKRLDGRYDEYFDAYYQKWEIDTEEEYEKVSDDQESFFRKYAGTNRHEFFAVCIEYFFEKSEEFKKQVPLVYNELSLTLNQDPMSNDTKIKSLKYKTVEENVAGSFLSPVIFKSSFPNSGFVIFLLFFLGYCILVSLNWNSTNGPGPLIFFGIIVGMTMWSFLRIGRIILHEKYIVINNIFGKLKAIYPLDEFLTITFDERHNINSIIIYVARDGKIYKNSFPYVSGSDDIDEIVRFLREKKISVKEYTLKY